MGLKRKLEGAVIFWTDPHARRTGILGSCLTYAGGIILIGIVFLALASTGTFPASVSVLQSAGLFAMYLTKYSMYILSGLLAGLGVALAYRSLQSSTSTTISKALLCAAVLTVVVSAALTIATLAMSSGHAKWYTYLIDIVVIIVRLLFASTMLMAIWTLNEADKDATIAQIVLSGREEDHFKLPLSQPNFPQHKTLAAFHPPTPAYHPQPQPPPPAAAAAASAVGAGALAGTVTPQALAAGMVVGTPAGSYLPTSGPAPYTTGAAAGHFAPVSPGTMAGDSGVASYWETKMARKAARYEQKQQRRQARFG